MTIIPRALYRGVYHTKILDFRAPLYPKIAIQYTKYRFDFTIYWQTFISDWSYRSKPMHLPFNFQSIRIFLNLRNWASIELPRERWKLLGRFFDAHSVLHIFNESNISKYSLCRLIYKIQIPSTKIPLFSAIYTIQFLAVQGPIPSCSALTGMVEWRHGLI